ncbi:rod shape-determining protein MreD [Maribacter sp. MAR_2009_72]|uniref:rod shape-determining protein MreD n=1 Tax=Maribacter sp. MAR_2009_72 TaxID=1250050 RepID=UPI00119C6CD1|nr:rod shape-determining protein MreD [Maribacter sp. MAR_2009_72]TVZ15554.1 rod shape-determining protein MreD [Maribacter sp. MAR_2009_72]
MINSGFFRNVTRFVLLILVQVLVFNNLNFFGYINPLIYILFLYWYPIKQNRTTFIVTCFILGLLVDIFSDTLAINAAATVTIAYLRPTIMRFVFGVNYEFQSFKLNNSTKAQQFTFLALLTIIHHLVYFTLEIFSFSNSLLILQKTVTVGIATLILSILFSTLFSSKKE